MQSLLIGLAALGGLGVFGIFYALAVPRLRLRRVQAATLQGGLQVRLDHAGLGVTAGEFMLRGSLYGLAASVIGYLASGTIAAAIPFIAGGFIYLWVNLEDKRNQRVNRYNHNLAVAMDNIVNAWQIQPSLTIALEAVAKYGPGVTGEGVEKGSVADDFGDILRSLRTGVPLRDALQAVADRRKNPVFDGLAIALLVAEEQGTQAGEMLARQATIARKQVAAFNEAITRQKTHRTEVQNGTLGPWAILLLVRLLNVFMNSNEGMENIAPSTQTFFSTPAGAAVAFGAAALTVGMYAWAMQIASRGLLLTRVPTEHGKEATV